MVGPTFDKQTFSQYPVLVKSMSTTSPTMITAGGQSRPCQLGSECQSLDLHLYLIDVTTIVTKARCLDVQNNFFHSILFQQRTQKEHTARQ